MCKGEEGRDGVLVRGDGGRLRPWGGSGWK